MNSQPRISIDKIISQTNYLALLLQLYQQDVSSQSQQLSFNNDLKSTWVQESVSQENRMHQEQSHSQLNLGSMKFPQIQGMQIQGMESQNSHNLFKNQDIFQQSSSQNKSQYKGSDSQYSQRSSKQELKAENDSLQKLLGKAIQSCLQIVDIEFQIKKTSQDMKKQCREQKKGTKFIGQSQKGKKFH